MALLQNGKPLKTYKVALGGQPVGAKDREGDHKTPEGVYKTSRKRKLEIWPLVSVGTPVEIRP